MSRMHVSKVTRMSSSCTFKISLYVIMFMNKSVYSADLLHILHSFFVLLGGDAAATAAAAAAAADLGSGEDIDLLAADAKLK